MIQNSNQELQTQGSVSLILNLFFLLFKQIKLMKQYFCVGSYLPFDSINKSQINNSKAKQTFSFSKSKRFQDFKSNCKVVSYKTNQFKLNKQGIKIGTSQRSPITIFNDNPPPGRYRLKTDIQNEKHNFSFGMGRQIIKSNNYLNIEAKNYPSATKYEISQKFKQLYKNSPIYSMKKRYSTQNNEETSPGPARYNMALGKNGNLQLTKYKSISFSTSKSKRFNNDDTQPPGPGAYNTALSQSQINGAGNSRFHSTLGMKFPHSKRKTYIDDQMKKRASLPGPGNYRAPSQFGQYDGNIYQAFQQSSNNFHQMTRPQSEIRFQNGKLKRPSTSKH